MSIISWEGNIIEGKIPATVLIGPQWLVTGNATPIADIIGFKKSQEDLEPYVGLVEPSAITLAAFKCASILTAF